MLGDNILRRTDKRLFPFLESSLISWRGMALSNGVGSTSINVIRFVLCSISWQVGRPC